MVSATFFFGYPSSLRKALAESIFHSFRVRETKQNKTKVCRQTETNDSAKITLFCLAANASFFVCASFSNADEWGAHHKAVRIINDLLCHIFHLCPCPLSLALFHFFFIVFGYLYNALVFVPVSRCLDPEECDFTLIFCTPKQKYFRDMLSSTSSFRFATSWYCFPCRRPSLFPHRVLFYPAFVVRISFLSSYQPSKRK